MADSKGPWWQELLKAGGFAVLGSIITLVWAPPLEQMKADGKTCTELTDAFSKMLGITANPVSDTKANIDNINTLAAEMRQKAGNLGIATEQERTHTSKGPAIDAIVDLFDFADRRHAGLSINDMAHQEKLVAVRTGCVEQYSSWKSIPKYLSGTWSAEK